MKTTEEIYAELKADFESASGLTLSDGGDMSLRFMALAAQLESLYYEAEFVTSQSMPQTASGKSLDGFAAMRGLERSTAAAAKGKIRFYAAEGVTASVEAGTRCQTENGVEYETTAGGTVSTDTWYCDLPAVAVNTGSAGNTPAGTVTVMMLPPKGIAKCRNMVAFTGGSDPESDEELRKRLLDSYKSMINGGNAAYYKALALSCEGIVAAQVVPKSRGIGTVDVYVAQSNGPASTVRCNAVQAVMEENREICTDVQVKVPTISEVDVEVKISPSSGYYADKVADDVELAIAAFFDGKMLGRNVLVAELAAAVYSVEGVSNYRIVKPAADIEIAQTVLPTLGLVSVGGGI